MKGTLTILLVFSFLITSGQSGTMVFNDTLVHEIRITFPYESWFDSLETDYQLNLDDKNDLIPEREFLCDMVFDGIFLDSIGMRQRGNYSNFSAPLTSSNGLKKPFKLDFNAFKQEQRFDGLRELNLNNGTDDPSFVREALVYKLIRDQSVPASRTGYARLYVNDAYWGLYELVENVDKTYLQDYYGKNGNDGNLYKTARGAQVDLTWKGWDYQAYLDQGLLLKTNKETNDWSKVINFIYVINHTAPGNMKQALSAVFDVEAYLDILAVEVLSYSWDSYWGNGNNFYLYEHPDGRIRWIPWDYNETFTYKGGLLGILLPQQSDIFLSTHFKKKPLLKAIFSVREWQDLYLEKICNLCTNAFSNPAISPVVRKWQKLIRPSLEIDTNALGTMQSFDYSLTTDMDNAYNIPGSGTGFNIKVPGLLPYIAKQREWAIDEIKKQEGSCPLTDVSPFEYQLTLFPNPVFEELNLSWSLPTSGVYRILIYDSMGRMVFTSGWRVNDGFEDKISVDQLPKGLYYLRKQDVEGLWGDGKFIKT